MDIKKESVRGSSFFKLSLKVAVAQLSTYTIDQMSTDYSCLTGAVVVHVLELLDGF